MTNEKFILCVGGDDLGAPFVILRQSRRISYTVFLCVLENLRFAQDDKFYLVCRGELRSLAAGANSQNSGTLLFASQTFPRTGESPPPYARITFRARRERS